MGQFDDLIPKGKKAGGQFADLVPKKKEPEIGGVPVSEIPTIQKIGYGIASSLARPIAGIGQMTGLMSDERAREIEGRVTAIRDTTPGKVAGIGADVAQWAVPLSKIGALPKVAQYAASAGVGAGMGALDPVTEEGESRLKNTALGGALGIAGQGAGDALMMGGKALANTVNPEVKAIYEAAKARGINLTPAQLSDSKFIGYLRKQLAALPGSGAASQEAKQRQAFNAAASRTMGESAPMSNQVFDQALDRLGGEFDRFASRPLPLTNGFVRNLEKIAESAKLSGLDGADRIAQNMVDFVKRQPGGRIDGKVVQAMDTKLRKLATRTDDAGEYARTMREALHDHIEKNMPRADFGAWRKTRGEYRNAMKIMGLVAKDGDVAPGKLMGAMTNDNAGKRAMARGKGGELGNLARIGQKMKAPPTSGSPEGVQAAAVGAGFWANPLATLGGLTAGRVARGVTDSNALAAALMNRGKGIQAVAPYMRTLVPASGAGVMRYPYIDGDDDGP